MASSGSSYRPQSPDLSSYAPQSPNLAGYRPQSPDLSGLGSNNFGDQFSPQHSQHPPHHRQYLSGEFGGGFVPPPFQPTSIPIQQFAPPVYAQQYPSHFDMPPVKNEEDDFLPDASAPKRSRKQAQQNTGSGFPSQLGKKELGDPTLGVVLKTSFPVARIKRIMQADEDIGKVAQVTPHVVSRALELFMIKLITSSAEQARGPASAHAKGPRRVLAQHMKHAIQADDTFDFLADIIAKVPDAPSKAKKEANSDSEDAKPRKRGKKRKESSDDV